MRRVWLGLVVLAFVSACTASSVTTSMRDNVAVPSHTSTPSRSDTPWTPFTPMSGEAEPPASAACQADGHTMACSVKSGDSDRSSGGEEEVFAENLTSDFAIDLYQEGDTLAGSETAFSEVLAQGKPVVLVFWAGGCPICRRELPEIEAVSAQFEDEVVFVGIDVGPHTGLGTRADGMASVEELDLTFPVGSTPEISVLRDYGVTGVPMLLFFTPSGEQVDGFTGAMGEEAMARTIENLLEASR